MDQDKQKKAVVQIQKPGTSHPTDSEDSSKKPQSSEQIPEAESLIPEPFRRRGLARSPQTVRTSRPSTPDSTVIVESDEKESETDARLTMAQRTEEGTDVVTPLKSTDTTERSTKKKRKELTPPENNPQRSRSSSPNGKAGQLFRDFDEQIFCKIEKLEKLVLKNTSLSVKNAIEELARGARALKRDAPRVLLEMRQESIGLQEQLEKVRRQHTLAQGKIEALKEQLTETTTKFFNQSTQFANKGTNTDEVLTCLDGNVPHPTAGTSRDDNKPPAVTDTEQLLCRNCGKRVEQDIIKKKAEAKVLQELEEKITDAVTKEAILMLADNTWPTVAHQRVSHSNVNVLTDREVRVLIVQEDNAADEKILNGLRLIFPKADRACSMAPNKIICMMNQISMNDGEDSEGDSDDMKRVLIIGKTKSRKDPSFTTEDIATLQEAIRKARIHTEEQKPLVWISEGLKNSTACNALEIICRQEEISVEATQKRKAAMGTKSQPRTKPREQTIRIHNVGGGTCDETLNKIREAQLDLNAIGAEVQRFSQTKDGELLIKVRESQEGGVKTFADMIKTATNLEVESKVSAGPLTTVIIREIDPTLKQPAIESAIRHMLKCPDVSIRVGPIKSQTRGGWSTLVTLPAFFARKLLGLRVIRLGLMKSRVAEWFSLPCCYNCQKIGHLATSCTEKRATAKLCHKCGEGDHTAKDCKADIRSCYNCGEAGHAANSVKCPIYRKGLAELRVAKQEEALKIQEKKRPPKAKNLNTNKSSVDKDGFQTPGRRNTRRLTKKEKAKLSEETGMEVNDETSTDYDASSEHEQEEDDTTIDGPKTQCSASGKPE